MSIRWDSENDWKNNQDSSGTTGRNGELKQGYRRDRPPLTDGLVGYWPLHDNSATDYSGNDNHGNLNGGVTTGVAGKGGLQAMSFDGSDDYIDVSGAENSSFPVTISAWVRGSGNGRVYSESTGSNSDNILGINIRGDPATANLYLRGQQDTPVISKSNTEVRGSWHHIVGVATSNELRIYVDGVLENTESHSRPFPNVSNANIGRLLYGGGSISYFDGIIGECRTYSHALSSEEIQTLYEWGSGDYARPPTDGVSYYKLDGDATDSWSDNNGSMTDVSFSSGKRGQAGVFNGSSSEISTSSSQSFNWSQYDGVTVNAWVRPTADPQPQDFAMIFDSGFGTGTFAGYSLEWRPNTPYGQIFCGDNIQVDTWTMLTLVINDTEGIAKAYYNTTPKNSVSGSSDQLTDNRYFAIGDNIDSSNNDTFEGLIDEIRVYGRTLSHEEIFELYRYGTRGRDMRKFLVNH